MSAVRLEHVNVTVKNPDETATWLCDVFGWHIRWQGEAIDKGRSIHVGETNSYLAIYAPSTGTEAAKNSYRTRGGLNHIAVVVDDLAVVEDRVKAAGFTPGQHHDYEPGRRFYFRDDNNIEFEVVEYD